jgi:hypothetical protein
MFLTGPVRWDRMLTLTGESARLVQLERTLTLLDQLNAYLFPPPVMIIPFFFCHSPSPSPHHYSFIISIIYFDCIKMPCPAGFYSGAGAWSCQMCQPGQYLKTVIIKLCLFCLFVFVCFCLFLFCFFCFFCFFVFLFDSIRFNPDQRASTCIPCPAGIYFI